VQIFAVILVALFEPDTAMSTVSSLYQLFTWEVKYISLRKISSFFLRKTNLNSSGKMLLRLFHGEFKSFVAFRRHNEKPNVLCS
jgi:hypothetical protein